MLIKNVNKLYKYYYKKDNKHLNKYIIDIL